LAVAKLHVAEQLLAKEAMRDAMVAWRRLSRAVRMRWTGVRRIGE